MLSQLTSIQQGADTSTLRGRASTKGTVLAPELKEGETGLPARLTLSWLLEWAT